MARFGRNTKLTIDASLRQPVRALFEGALGSKVLTPAPNFEVYVLDDDARVGVAYVPASDALSSEDQKKGAWLEFVVEDEPKARDELGKLGLSRIDYTDEAHAYYQVPGGPVFRLAPRAHDE